ncbi:substrate-binding domain-containing protein [Frankia sp. Cppng1_Ct_nod]|uniref:sugar ABC transporter substrate-binding protein n=1 Tax=Frankia sp. Cppng1_Ct_nod TaxID=2897162 RepID=UPI0020258A45|nr:substrate-binding domain-containing protein [Frankia sp. Cppng1_Ct_nod]
MLKKSTWPRAITVGTLALAAATFLAACGGTKPASTVSGTTASAGTSTSNGATDLAALSAVVAKYKQAPTTIPISTPLKQAPAKGKTFVFLQCDVAQCAQLSKAFTAATAAIGWELKVIPYKSADPATLISGLRQALQYNPVAVGVTGIPGVVWQSEVPAYEKAGVPIVVGHIGPQAINNTIIANINDEQSVQATAEALAAYFIVNSEGKGKILQFQVPDFPILDAFDKAFRAKVQASCPGCSVTPLTGTISQVTSGGSTAAIVSALQRHPEVDWVVTDNGPWVAGLPAALEAAHLKVKVIGAGADVATETDIKAGKATAFTGVALNYSAWAMLDAVLRHLEGTPISASEGLLPIQLLTKDENFAVSESYDEPADYAAQMEKLWHVGA